MKLTPLTPDPSQPWSTYAHAVVLAAQLERDATRAYLRRFGFGSEMPTTIEVPRDIDEVNGAEFYADEPDQAEYDGEDYL